MTTSVVERRGALLGPLSWVLIYVDNLDVMRDFYEGGLGLTPREANDDFANYYTGGCTLELMARPLNGPTQSSSARGWDRNRMHISFKVERIEQVVAALAERGIVPRHGIAETVPPPGRVEVGRLAQFEDPEGNFVEICDEAVYP